MPELTLNFKGKTYRQQYLECGNGDEVVFVYHGFGQKKEDYLCLTSLFPAYRFVVFDLFDHGESDTVGNHEALIPLYCMAFDEMRKQLNLQEAQVLGFSIGSRVAATVSTHGASWVKKMVLVAPDVTPEPLLFRLVMHTPLRWLVYITCKIPWVLQVVFFVLKNLLGSPFSFYHRLWKQPKIRKRLWNTWNGLRNTRKLTNWNKLVPFTKVWVLSKEDILNNKRIRAWYEKRNIFVGELRIDHYNFPMLLKDDDLFR